MIENTATRMRDTLEHLMHNLSEEDEVYQALGACQARLNTIVWNRYATHHQMLQQAKRRATFARRHQRAR